MCDTLVVVEPDVVWFAKNSDREPGEAQVVEHHARRRHATKTVRATYVALDQVDETHETALSRPAWMWGAEMGANEHGLAVGNEAVFTRVPVEPTGLLGMDLVRLALERCRRADEALDRVTWLIARHGQGGPAGFRNRRFAYHNAFVFADPEGAWLLETAGRFWAAERIARGARSTSNVLTIGERYDRVGPGTIEGARALGLLGRGQTFDFRRCFGQPAMRFLSGGDVRRACTVRGVPRGRAPGWEDMLRVVRDHAGTSPHRGARMLMPCAHASWLPTRHAGQTTGTQVSRLSRQGSAHLFTGTSAPCLSVLKPVPLGQGPVDTGPHPRVGGADRASLFWRAEGLHRVVLRDYEARRAAFEGDRAALEARAREATTPGAASDAWREHAERVVDWTRRAARVPATHHSRAFHAWWRLQSWRDGLRGGAT